MAGKRRFRKGRKRGGKRGRKRKFMQKEKKKYSISSTILKFPSSVWPEEIRTNCLVSGTTFMSSIAGSLTRDYVWFANSFGDGVTGLNGVGPQINATGVFTKIYPNGLPTLLQSPRNAGSTAPYEKYRINRSCFFFRIMPQAITAGTANSAYVRVAVLPSTNGSYSTMTQERFVEQPLVKEIMIENPVLRADGGSIATIPDKWHKCYANVENLYGVPRGAIGYTNLFWNDYQTIANQTAFYNMKMTGDGGAGLFNITVEWKIVYDTTFFDRNPLIDGVNT